ncbi:MAG: malto-oligosyltrehalose synthase [Cuniculiplasma sp.]
MRNKKINMPKSTYRIQLSSNFTFSDLERQLNYLKELGISHLYLSPIMEAAEGSTHFYNTFDFTKISEVLGGEEGFRSLSGKSHGLGMGIILDIVPNHMTILNRFMIDYLQKGKKSGYEKLFDMDLNLSQNKGKLILPLLDFYPVEEIGRIKLNGGKILVDQGDLKLPFLENSEIRDDPILTLRNQIYVLTHFKESNRMINYRRFFAVNDLIGIRIEKKNIFDLFHRKIAQLMSENLIDGLRVDHVDGLNDPLQYLKRLNRLANSRPIWIEKILARDEYMDENWPVQGDTGYSARSRIISIFINEERLDQIKKIFRDYGGKRYEGERYRLNLKIEISKKLFQADLEKYSQHIKGVLETENISGISVKGISEALRVTISCFNEYRTYTDKRDRSHKIWEENIERARGFFPDLSQELFFISTFIKLSRVNRRAMNILKRIEQFMGAVMAKSMEDCYFFRYVALLSVCLVGSMPFEDHYSDLEIHEYFSSVNKSKKKPMINLSTHDTKFGEDAIARFNVLQDIIPEWNILLRRFNTYAGIREFDKYRVLEVILGTIDERDPEYENRLCSYLIKALRESGEETSWEKPSMDYEKNATNFALSALNVIRNDFREMLSKIEFFGGMYSLSQSILKFTFPGVPDTYQGSELINLSFVDPDNRRGINFGDLEKRFSRIRVVKPELKFEDVVDGSLKMWITWKLLSIRSKYDDIFTKGKYKPLEFSGLRSNNLFGFMYEKENKNILVIITRHYISFMNEKKYDADVWKGTRISNLPPMNENIRNFLATNRIRNLNLHEILLEFPFAILEVERK